VPDRRGNGTLVIAALLTLGLLFAAVWIVYYVTPGLDPRTLFSWFGLAAAVIVALGLLYYAGWGRAGGGSR
jgi:hypothetical protein